MPSNNGAIRDSRNVMDGEKKRVGVRRQDQVWSKVEKECGGEVL